MFSPPTTIALSADIELTPEEMTLVNDGHDTFGKSGFGTPIALLGLFDEPAEPGSDVEPACAPGLEPEPPSYVLTRNVDGSFALVGVYAPTELVDIDGLRDDIAGMPDTVRRPLLPIGMAL